MAKQRADQLLVERGLAESRTRAQALIMAGLVFVGERKLAKAGEMLGPDVTLDVRGKDHPWVSRGGLKLDHGSPAARPRSTLSMSAPTSSPGSFARTRASPCSSS